MKLTDILGKGLEELGLYLEEEVHILYLKHGDEVIAAFSTSGATPPEIRETAQRWARNHDKEKTPV